MTGRAPRCSPVPVNVTSNVVNHRRGKGGQPLVSSDLFGDGTWAGFEATTWDIDNDQQSQKSPDQLAAAVEKEPSYDTMQVFMITRRKFWPQVTFRINVQSLLFAISIYRVSTKNFPVCFQSRKQLYYPQYPYVCLKAKLPDQYISIINLPNICNTTPTNTTTITITTTITTTTTTTTTNPTPPQPPTSILLSHHHPNQHPNHKCPF